LVEPPIRAFESDLLLVSAGFDAGAGDLIGGMRVSEEGFAEMARRARGLSERVALVLEGGYTLETLPGFVRAVAQVF
jgi:acetoin utilization deacetylase AcuC-like enzyme